MTTFDRFIGIPYLDKGRTIEACDCWGLVAVAYRELRGIDIPSYAERYVTASDRLAMARLIAGELDDWHEIEPGCEQTLDVALMREGKFTRHTGLVVSPGMLLHVQPGGTSCIERYRSGVLANRIVGFYRYRDHE